MGVRKFYNTFLFCAGILIPLLFLSVPVPAALKTTDLESAAWTTVSESSIIDEAGWLQAMCATDQYIVCLINNSKTETTPDTLIAFYRNDTDAEGNPVQKYGYAFHVTERDYEHGNGMTYNPNTQEIAIAGLYTNDPSNVGAVFIIDANTLRFKRQVQVGNGSINFFGIDYRQETDQYILMANRISDYSFYITDNTFDIKDKVNMQLSASRSSFQDFIVAGDTIISLPYMQREGYMNIVDVYSLSQAKRTGSYYLTLPDASDSVEPEGICQLEPGHLLLSCAVKGTTLLRLYEAWLPLVHSVTTSVENGWISDGQSEITAGESYTVSYGCEDHYRLRSLVVDGEEIDASQYPSEYVFSDLQADHTISAAFEEIPQYTITSTAEHGTVETEVTGSEHESVTINLTPEEHYELTSLTIDGQAAAITPDMTTYTFEDLTADHTLAAVFSAIPQYTVSVQVTNGTAAVSQITVYRGESCEIDVTPDSSCFLTKCLVDGTKQKLKRGNNGYLLENIQGNHTLTFVYTRIWIWVFLAIGAVAAALLAMNAYLIMQRKKKRRRRRAELDRFQREGRELFENLPDDDL